MPRDCNRTGLGRMVKLAMTALGARQFPSFFLQSFDDVPNFQCASAFIVGLKKCVRNERLTPFERLGFALEILRHLHIAAL